MTQIKKRGHYHTAKRENGDVFKIIRLHADGELAVNYCNQGDAIGVLLVLGFAKKAETVRVGVKRLTDADREAYYREQESIWMGSGI